MGNIKYKSEEISSEDESLQFEMGFLQAKALFNSSEFRKYFTLTEFIFELNKLFDVKSVGQLKFKIEN